MSDHFIQQNRKLLDGILDQLIPANPEKRIPSAGAFGVGDFITARADADIAVSIALNELLSSALSMNAPPNSASTDAPSNIASVDESVSVEMVEQLELNNAKSFAVLLRLTYMGYYSRPEIRSLVGVGSWPVHPKGYEVPVEPVDMLEKLTAPVVKRGQAYREPNDEQAHAHD